ncbi:hypothetical protein LIER_34563 [Lithospermum erythrorhizon]|uniref:RNase H type-1 domain-containing protein n=1 Tax=Lithospermum erythrorhizon TaxID=34254 RepID=A0AAV3S2P0_LITER
MDEARNSKGSRVGILIRGPNEMTMEYGLRFSFETTNNEPEYEAMIAGLMLVRSLGVQRVLVRGESNSIIDQIKGQCGVKNETLIKYHEKDLTIAKGFEETIFEHVPRAKNEEADRLSQLATTYYHELPHEVYIKLRDHPAYEEETLCTVLEEPDDWRTPIAKYLVTWQLPNDKLKGKKVQNRIYKFHMLQGELYRKSVDGPLLVCVSTDNIPKVLFEAKGGVEYSVVVVDYFNKWVEAAPLKKTKGDNIVHFLWKHIITRFGVPMILSNGHVEVMNHIVFNRLKKNLVQTEEKRGTWLEELPIVLWSLRTTPSHATKETTFGLVYGTEAVLPVEVGLPTYRKRVFEEAQNNQRISEHLNFTDELRDTTLYKMVKYKHLMARSYNRRVKSPYKVTRVVGPETYELSHTNGKPIPHIWHTTKLRKYYV